MLLFKPKLRWLFVVVGLLAVIAFGGFLYYRYAEKWRHTFHVTFLNIGQGDSALINFADGTTMLVDCGPNKKVLSELGKTLPFYVRTIDYVLATHPDLDHYGGCVDVLKRYDVKHIIINGKSKNDAYYREWDTVMKAEGVDIVVMHAPQTRTIAKSTLQFLAPDDSLNLDTSKDDSNNYSIVFKLTSNTGRTFLFTGDMEQPLEMALTKKYCYDTIPVSPCEALRADTLKVGHHGSDSSSSELFLRMVSPRQAILSVGKNKYGHPSLRTIRHLDRTGADVLRTDVLGDIMIK